MPIGYYPRKYKGKVIKCEKCGKELYVRPYLIGIKKFCSVRCGALGRPAWNKGKIGFKMSEETKQKMSKSRMGRTSGMLGKKMSDESKRKLSLSQRRVHTRIIAELDNLTQQGFRCVPVGGKVKPDIIAIKDGKVFAVEVEYGKPNYAKYTDDVRVYFDDIIWIIKNKNEPRKR